MPARPLISSILYLAILGYAYMTRTVFARDLMVSLKENSSAYGYSICITGGYALLNALGKTPTTLDIFAAAMSAIAGFVALELAGIALFHNVDESDAQSTRFFARMMDFLSIGAAMSAAWLAGYFLDGVAAWSAAGFAISIVFVLLQSLELAATALVQERTR